MFLFIGLFGLLETVNLDKIEDLKSNCKTIALESNWFVNFDVHSKPVQASLKTATTSIV